MLTSEQREALESAIGELGNSAYVHHEKIADGLRSILASAAPAEEREWQPIETAPKDGTRIRLAWCPDDWTTGEGFWRGGKWVACAAFYSARLPHPHIELRECCPEPTRWMPLSPAPNTVATPPTTSEAARDEWADRCMGLAHRWAQATYMKGLSKPHEDFGEIRKELRRTLLERIERAAAKGESE